MKEHVVQCFTKLYGHAPEVVARAPGRIEFIGNHTDYNGGTVLGAAINFWGVGGPSGGRRVANCASPRLCSAA